VGRASAETENASNNLRATDVDFRKGTLRPWLRRLLGTMLVAGAALLAVAALSAVYLRRDQTHVFLETRDRITGARSAKTWSTGRSRVERLELLDAAGAMVSTVLVRVPVAPAASRRTLVVYAGKETGDRILDLIPERPDVLLVAPLYPESDPRGVVETLLWPHTVRAAVFATVAGGMGALAHLDEVGVPRGTTVVLAASLGSSFGTIHAALDRRVDELVVIHGGGDFPLILHRYYEGRERPFAAALVPFLARGLIDTFDPVHWIGRVAPRPVLLIASRRDKYFPVESVEALAAAARGPTSILWTDTDHVGASKTEIVAAIVAEIEAYLDGEASRRYAHPGGS
jgi:pimeloyl-ACP methyl ester carboxylesterase